jgi:pimeloyl-ACP methyl ester carboxylesterase
MNRRTSFLLLPGGGMSSWVWRDCIPLLDVPAITPEYRLPRNDEHTRTTATVRDCVNHCVDLVDRSGCEAVIPVGHSGAGALAAAVAKAIPDRVPHVVYVSANLPKNHRSPLEALPWLVRAINAKAIRSQVKSDSSPAAKMEGIIRKVFCNTCPEETVRYVLGQDLLSEPLCLAFEKVDWDDFPDIPQTYVVLTLDKTQNEKGQRAMMKNLGIRNAIEIESDHMVMLGRPRELCTVLNRISSACVRKV